MLRLESTEIITKQLKKIGVRSYVYPEFVIYEHSIHFQDPYHLISASYANAIIKFLIDIDFVV